MHITARTARTFLRALLIGLLVATGVALSPLAAHAGEGDVVWTVRTASNALGADRTAYSYTVPPGSTIDDAMVVTNRGTQPLDLGVYAADGFTTDSGQFDLIAGGEASARVGAWVHSDTASILVPAGASVEVPFSVTVPRTATPGDYAGGIVTSLVQPDAPNGINVDRRLGIKITLRVSGELRPDLAVDGVSVDWHDGLNPFNGGDATLTYTIRNTGNATLSSRQAATLSGPFGWFAGDAPAIAPPPPLLPGESWRMTVPVDGVAPVLWLAASVTVTPAVVDASGSTVDLKPIMATAHGLALPWTLLVLLLLVVAAIVIVPRLARRRQAVLRAREDARVQAAVESALVDRAAAGSGASKG